MPLSTTRWPYNHGSVFEQMYCRLWTELNCQLGNINRKACNKWGSLRWNCFIGDSDSNLPVEEHFLWYCGVCVCVVGSLRCLCAAVQWNRVHFDTEKRSDEMLMMYMFCLWCMAELGTAALASFLNISIEFPSKRCSPFESQQPFDKVHLIHLAGLFWWLTTKLSLHLINHRCLLVAENTLPRRWYGKMACSVEHRRRNLINLKIYYRLICPPESLQSQLEFHLTLTGNRGEGELNFTWQTINQQWDSFIILIPCNTSNKVNFVFSYYWSFFSYYWISN